MPQADANRSSLAYLLESTYGTTPAGTFTLLRHTGESLKKDTGTVTSNEIRDDRSIVDIVRNSIGVSGDINFELAYGVHDVFWEAALQSDATWNAVATITQTAATWIWNATNKTMTAAATEDFSGTNKIAVGDMVKFAGFVNAANNCTGIVSAVTATVVTMNIDASNLTNETLNSGGSVAVFAKISNGVLLKSYSIERKYADLTNTFALYTGCCVDSVSLSMASDQIITGSFGILGKNEVSAAATESDSAYTAAATALPMNSIDNVVKIAIDGLTVGCTGFTMQLQNNMRQRQQIGTLGPVSVGSGFCQVSGTMTMYFESSTQFDKYLNFGEVDLQVVLSKSVSSTYGIHIPAMKFTGGQRVGGGVNTDIMAELTWSAFKDTTYATTMSMHRIV